MHVVTILVIWFDLNFLGKNIGIKTKCEVNIPKLHICKTTKYTNLLQFWFIPVRPLWDEDKILDCATMVILLAVPFHQKLVFAVTFGISAVMLGPAKFFWAVLGHRLGFNKRSLTVGMVKKETHNIITSYNTELSTYLFSWGQNIRNKHSMMTVGYEVITKTTKQL